MTLEGWNYRKSHIITHPTGGLTNYQTKIRVYRTTGTDSADTVYVGDKCLADFGDIRFTNSAGDELSYWMETSNATYADFWVKLDNITTSATFYIYYGNNWVSTTSNGNTTFDFFDDFTGDLSKWTNMGGTTISGGIATISATSTAIYGITSTQTFGTGYAVAANVRYAHYNTSSYLEAFFSNYISDTNFVSAYTCHTGGSAYYPKYNNVTNGTLNGVAMSGVSAGNYLRHECKKMTTSAIWSVNYESEVTNSSQYVSTAGAVRFVAYGSGSSISIDWIYVRKYNAIDIIHSSWGFEQDLSATSFTIRITPTTGTDPLSVTYNCIIPEGTLTNFVLNYGDGNEYTPDPIYTPVVSLTQSGSFGTVQYIVSYRNVIPSASINTSSANIRLKLIRPTSGYYTISHASIVERDGTTANGTTTPTHVTFNNGNNGITISSSDVQYIYSDIINFNLDNTKDYLVIIDFSDVTNNSTPGFDGTSYVKLNEESWNQHTVYSYNTTSIRALVGIEYTTSATQSSFATTHTYDTPGTYTVWGEGYTEFATHVYYEIPYGVTVTAPSVVASFTTSQSF